MPTDFPAEPLRPAAPPPRGLLVSLLTPFDARGRVDLARLRAHVLWLSAQGVDGFVPTIAAGEFLYLTDREREAVHRTVLDAARGKQVYPGVWDASPATTAFLTDAARDQGAAGVVLAPPLGYDIDERVLEVWYEPLADKQIGVWLYDEPTLCKLPPGGYAHLRGLGLVSGLLAGSEDPHRVARAARATPHAVYATSDRLLVQARRVPELRGCVSTLANAWPSFCRRLFQSGEAQLEDALTERLHRVHEAGGLRALKALLRMPCRAPLVEAAPGATVGLPAAEMP